MFDGNMREQVDRAVQPVGAALVGMGITADVMTLLGIAMSATAAIVIGSGQLMIGVLLMALTGLPDLLDGAIAKEAGTSSTRGAYFDSVADRFTDIVLFSGVAWYLSDVRDDQMHMLPVAVMGMALMISYQRAKAESLGFDAKGGLMERAERFIALGVGLFLGAFSDTLLIATLWVMFVLTAVTAIQRFFKVWKQASVGRPTPPPGPISRRRARDARRSSREPLAQRWRRLQDRR
ncbi:MAG: CDP-alcohol phosphatidyltransferase family protein [Acidimicrobiales bacterium]